LNRKCRKEEFIQKLADFRGVPFSPALSYDSSPSVYYSSAAKDGFLDTTARYDICFQVLSFSPLVSSLFIFYRRTEKSVLMFQQDNSILFICSHYFY